MIITWITMDQEQVLHVDYTKIRFAVCKNFIGECQEFILHVFAKS